MAESNEKRGLLGVIDASAKILTPIVIFAVGTFYTWTKDNAAREQSELDRCYGYAKDLAKAGAAEQTMLLGFIQSHCTGRDELRAATLPQVVQTATQSKDAEVRATATNTATVSASSAAANTNLVTKVEQALLIVPRNIYIQIPTEDQRDEAMALKSQLADAVSKESDAYTIPGIEVVGNDSSPNTTQVRYFRSEDAAEAQRIASLLVKFGMKDAVAVASKGSARPFQLEIWFPRVALRNPRVALPLSSQ